MADNYMTIRFTPDGFSFAEYPEGKSFLLDEAPFHEIAPGPDFQHRLQEAVLDQLPQSEKVYNVRCQLVSNRVIILSPDMTDSELAIGMFRTTLGETEEEEQIMFQPLVLENGQMVTLCFGIDHSLYNFLQRNFGEITFEHHLASLLTEGAKKAAGNCLVVRCNDRTLELAFFQEGRLGLANIYQTSQADSRSYYVMNTWQQLGLNQLEDNLLVLGSGTEALQVRASLHRFIKHVFS